MKAELIAVGTEILLGQIDNSHARYLSQELAGLGVSVYFHSTVGDNEERVVQLVDRALARSDVIIVTGGLGPTADDLTREAVARSCGLRLTFSQAAFDRHVAPYFARIGRAMPETNRRQAFQVGSAEFLVNPRGTAPGQYIETNGRHIFLLPGPPLEMRPMFQESVKPVLARLVTDGVIVSRVLHLFGIGESGAAERIADLLANQSNPTIAPLASEGEMMFRLTAKADDEVSAKKLIDPVELLLRKRFGHLIYGVDADSLVSVTLDALRQRGLTMAVAESCTGGMLASMIVDRPGCSSQFRGGVVAYDNAVKVSLLGIDRDVIDAHGAVSEPVAVAMAAGVRRALGADVGVGITGVAGPDGGSTEKPVGLVYVAVSVADRTEVRAFQFAGDRAQVRIRAAKASLHLVLQVLQVLRELQ